MTMHVLVVDERPEARAWQRSLVEQAVPGCVVTGAASVEEMAVGRAALDCVLVDAALGERCLAILAGAPVGVVAVGEAPRAEATATTGGAVDASGVAPLLDGRQSPGTLERLTREALAGPELARALRHAVATAVLRHALARCRTALAEARDQAVEATRLKLEFLGNIGHEVRTPLQGVFEMTDLLLETPLTPQQRRYAETARTCGTRLLAVMTDVLEFSKMVAGRLCLADEYFDVRRVADEVIGTARVAADAKELTLVSEVGGDVPWVVRGDSGRVRQILAKLVGNAVKFTEHGGVAVRIALTACSETHASVRFSVVDTGIGIPPDRLHRVFHSFSQGDGSTARRYEGTGLGLAIAKRLVEAMGGEIGLESEPGRGSTFWFVLRFAVGVPDVPSRTHARPALSS